MLHSEVPGAIRVIVESAPNLNVSLISDKPLYCQYKYVLSDHGNGLATSSPSTHFFLGSRISCISDWPGSYQRQIWHHREETRCLCPLHFGYLPVAIPRAVDAGYCQQASDYWTQEWKKGERRTKHNYFIAGPAKCNGRGHVVPLGCGRDVLKHPRAFSWEMSRDSIAEPGQYVIVCLHMGRQHRI